MRQSLIEFHEKIRHRLEMTALAGHIFSIPLYSSPENGKIAPYAYYFRSLNCWKYFVDYFPIRLHKTVELEPSFVETPMAHAAQHANEPPFIWKLTFWWYYHLLKPSPPKLAATGKRYIFGYHPHGIIGMGSFGGLATDGAGWSKLFPGIPVRLLTITNQFLIPVYREYLLSLGIASVAKNSVENLLKRYQPICIVLGGAQESLLAKPGKMDLVLKKRQGFIKLAMKIGNVDLVPMIAFGENGRCACVL